MGGSETELSMLWMFGFFALALLSQFFTTSSQRMFIGPAFVSLIFATSYPLSFSLLVNHSTRLSYEGWGSVGRFGFTNEAMSRPFQIVLAAILGLMAGTRLAEVLWARLRTAKVHRGTADPSMTSLVAWSLAGMTVIAVCATLGIGRVGLENTTVLPFRLAGILVFARSCLLPLLGAALVQRAIDAHEQRRLTSTLLLFAIYAATASVAAASRGLVAYCLVPLILFAISRQDAQGKPLRPVLKAATVMVFLLALVGFVATTQRATLYSSEGWMNLSEIFQQSQRGLDVFAGVLEVFSDLMCSRLSGLNVFLAVISGPGQEQDALIPVQLFLGNDTLKNAIAQEALGFLPTGAGGYAFGVAIPLFAVLGLGSTLVVPFLGTALLVLVACSVEGVLSRYGETGMGAVLGCLVLMSAWETPELFNFSRMLPMAIAVVILARQTNRGLRHAAASQSVKPTAPPRRGRLQGSSLSASPAQELH